MDELIDIVDYKGQPTGEICLKSEAHKKGILHASVHIWFYTSNQEILVQKRSHNKEIYPNLWDVSVAGHIESGESPINSAIREVSEEIGFAISKEHLLYKGIWEEKHHHSNGLIDHEIHHVYLAPLTCRLDILIPQKEEVADLKLINLNQLSEDCHKQSYFVPHQKEYYHYIINLLRETFSYEK